MFTGRRRDRTPYSDRFDAMTEGELAAEMMMMFTDYGEFYDTSFGMTEQERREWVRARNS